jgi:hypothetical protein
VTISFARTSSVECIGGFSTRGGACVEPLGGLFYVHGFLLVGFLSPYWPWLLLFLVSAAPLVPIWCTGVGLPCVKVHEIGTAVGISGTFHYSGHS